MLRIAAFILGIVLAVVMGLQSCAVYGLGSLAESLQDKPTGTVGGGGAGGILATILAIIAMAFVLPFPKVSMAFYALGAVVAFAAGSTGYKDMYIWAVAMLVLGIMCFFGRKKRLPSVETV